jgi:phosphonate transport system substrate-binding protein
VPRDTDKTTTRRRGTYAFGVVAGDSSVRAPLERLCNSLSRRMDVLLYPQVLRSYGALAAQLSAGGIDLAWLPPLLAAEAIEAGSVELVACLQRELGGLYHSVIFSRRDSGCVALGDLEGRSMAWVDRSSAAGYVVPRRWIELSGFSPGTMFSRETFAGTHAEAVRTVLRRTADAGATFAVLEPRSRKLLDSGWHAVPEAGDSLRVVASAGAVPSDAIAISLRVGAEIRTAIGAALFQLEDEEKQLVSSVFRSSGFERCAPVYVDMLRRLLGSAPR